MADEGRPRKADVAELDVEQRGLRSTIRWAGLLAGPLLAGVCYLALPDQLSTANGDVFEFSRAGRLTLAVMVWMATWWLTEAIEIAATALLPLVLFPLFGIAGFRQAAMPYANPLIFLFLGGFLLALAMERWGLALRAALLTLRASGTRPANLVGGIMLAAAALSMFVSNTATAAMMLPIGLSLIRLARGTSSESDSVEDSGFGVCLMLGLAYAATVGGLATIIGTPPNALLVAFVADSIDPAFRSQISFARWLMVGLPLTACFLPLVWLLLTRVLFRLPRAPIQGGSRLVRERLAALGPLGRGERVTLIVFAFAAVCWILRPLLARIEIPLAGGPLQPFAGWSDAGIAMTAALLLFVLPVDVRRHRFVLTWRETRELPWGILILFGGGLSLAAAVKATGVAAFFGHAVSGLPRLPNVMLVVIVATVVIFLTELTSNTATAATFLPILAAVAPGMGVHPYLLIFPAALAASCAFMMPVATPPNAIVFGSGVVSIPQMCRAGFWLNLIAVVLVTLVTLLIVQPLMIPADSGQLPGP